MTDKPIEGKQKAFMTGNEVVAWSALVADADIMFGYPITPQNEIMHYWTRLAPQYDRNFLQTEDEISAGFTTLGAALAGRKAFSATAGPGNTLFQEPMSMAEMMRIPTVMAITQRGGPSTATVIYSQQEATMTSYGGNGEGFRIVYSTSTHQELFDYTIKAFNSAWRHRFPAFVLGDGYQAKMREPLVMYDPKEQGIEILDTEARVGMDGTPGVDRDVAHLRNTYNTEDELYEVVMDLAKAYEDIAPHVVEHQTYKCDDAEIILTAHGVVYRACTAAADALREAGIKAGVFRPITLRPFPVEPMRETVNGLDKILVIESAYGQFKRQVTDALYGSTTEMDTIFKPGMGVTAEEIVERVKSY